MIYTRCVGMPGLPARQAEQTSRGPGPLRALNVPVFSEDKLSTPNYKEWVICIKAPLMVYVIFYPVININHEHSTFPGKCIERKFK